VDLINIYGDVSKEYRLTFEAEASADQPNCFYGFSISETEAFHKGQDIRFEPSNRKLGIHEIHCSSIREDEASSIYQVTGLQGRVTVEVIVKAGIIDICCNDNRTLVSRVNGKHCYLRFFVQFGNVVFTHINIRALTE
jgi:beta-fructofuranosidase